MAKTTALMLASSRFNRAEIWGEMIHKYNTEQGMTAEDTVDILYKYAAPQRLVSSDTNLKEYFKHVLIF